MTPKQIVKELDRYIIGQENAKKAVAIALRNRWRRKQIKGKLKKVLQVYRTLEDERSLRQ